MSDPFGRRCDDAGPPFRSGRIVCWHRGAPGQGVWVLWDGEGRPLWYPVAALTLQPGPPGPPPPRTLVGALLTALPPPRR